MALNMKERVKDTTATSGTGTYTLANSPPAGFRGFGAVGNGNTTYYCVTNGTDWEVGLGTVGGSGTSLTRDSILASSNGGAAVNWPVGGTRDAFITFPASGLMFGANNLSELASPSTARTNLGLQTPIAVASGGTGATTAATARTNLGLGTIATLNSPLPIANGGTGQTSALIPAGSKMLFAQASAPTGWTQDTTHNDRVLRVVSAAGGGTGGSWTISGISVDGHALTTDEMPQHTHRIESNDSNAAWMAGSVKVHVDGSGFDTSETEETGQGLEHTHGLTIGSAWRPAYVDCIICSKN